LRHRLKAVAHGLRDLGPFVETARIGRFTRKPYQLPASPESSAGGNYPRAVTSIDKHRIRAFRVLQAGNDICHLNVVVVFGYSEQNLESLALSEPDYKLVVSFQAGSTERIFGAKLY